MGKKKGKKDDVEKKLALQARKAAKAEKVARKRLIKAEGGGGDDDDGDDSDMEGDENAIENMDLLIEKYKQRDRQATALTKTVVESIEGFPLPRANATVTAVTDTKKKNAAVYMFGGEYYDGAQNVVLDQLFKLELNSLNNKTEWKQIITPTSPPARCAHSAIYYNKSLYIFGGELASQDEYHHYKDVWRFDTEEQIWHEIAGASLAAAKGAKKGKGANKPVILGSLPSPRSGHTAVCWKHYMVLFGGFYEAAKDVPRWYNDVYVLDLKTEQWLDIPHSKLSVRPEPRSACNASLLQNEDKILIHGGFSKLPRQQLQKQQQQQQQQQQQPIGSVDDAGDDSSLPTAETKVHTDAWLLHLKPILSGKPPTWERLTSSVPRKQWAISAETSPNGRCGTACLNITLPAGKGKSSSSRALLFGGVVDKELHHHKLDSVFYNDLYVMDVEKRRFFPLYIQNKSSNSNNNNDVGNERENEKENEEGNDDDDDDDDDNAVLDDPDENIDESKINKEGGWDLHKLRSNMFAFVDGEGNLIYEKIDEEKKVDESDDESEEEKEEEKEEEEKQGGKKPTDAAFSKIKASSVMALNPRTNKPEAIERKEPLPRIKSSLFINGQKLYIYGGLLEVGDREVTLDDLWCIDLKKRKQWECVFPGTMHQQVWRGAAFDDDDSYYSSNTGTNQSNDDDNNSDDEEEEEKEEEDEAIQKAKQKKRKGEIKKEIEDLVAQYDMEDVNRCPQPEEALADFYSRTSEYWNQLAATSSQGQSEKEIKRQGFALARTRFEELEPIIDRLQALTLERKKQKEEKSKSKKK